MAWPLSPDYNAAIQNPGNLPPALQVGSVVRDKRKLPFGIPGKFAVVYRMENPPQQFAVKCFTREVSHQQRRYEQLHHYLKGRVLDPLVGFDYFPQGIRVNGQWYPVLRMGWVPGMKLHLYIASHLGQRPILEQLARQWVGTMAQLKREHIAHGDIQHGNVLVDDHGRIRLVDYDGMFVPPLRYDPPSEVGHPNYQHPDRIRDGFYDENADDFSALVIYLSLLAVAADPSLWDKPFYDGQNLIFKEADFAAPSRSEVWDRLQRSPSVEVRRLATRLNAFCHGHIVDVKGLEIVVGGTIPTPPLPSVIVPPVNRQPIRQTVPSPPITVPSINRQPVQHRRRIHTSSGSPSPVVNPASVASASTGSLAPGTTPVLGGVTARGASMTARFSRGRRSFSAFVLITVSIVLATLPILEMMSPSLSIVDTGLPRSWDEARVFVTVQVLALRASPTYVDLGGRLVHDADNRAVEVQRVGEGELRDFIVEARYHNPYSPFDGAWDYGFFFRDTGSARQYRLVVTSDQRWVFHYMDGDVTDAVSERRGSLDTLDISRRGDNHLYLVVNGDSGYFFVNNDYVTTLDLSRKERPGNVLVVTGAISDQEITGESTTFENLTVYDFFRADSGNDALPPPNLSTSYPRLD